MMPRPNPINNRHGMLALAGEGMWQSAIAGCVGLTRATVNCILGRHAATGNLMPGMSRGLLNKPHLVKTVICWGWSDRIALSARALTAQMRNLYGIKLAGNLSTTGSCPVDTVPIDPQGSPCWLSTAAVSAWSGHRCGRTWQWPIGSISSSVTSPDSNFTR